MPPLDQLKANLMTEGFSAAKIALIYAVFSILWIIASGTLLTFTVSDPELQGNIEVAKGMLFVIVTSGLLYLLLKWRQEQTTAINEKIISAPNLLKLFVLFVALAMIAPITGVVVLQVYSPQLKQEAYSNLEAIAKLKSSQIENWLSERQSDAQALAANQIFAEQIRQYLQHRDARRQALIMSNLSAIKNAHGYDDILLLNTNGQLMLTQADYEDMTPTLKEQIRKSVANRTVQRGELYRGKNGQVHIIWAEPIFVSDTNGLHSVAIVLFKVSAQDFLYPLIRIWPTYSPSAESLLIRRDGEHFLYLNDLRHSKEAALNLRFSMSKMSVIIANHAKKSATTEGQDYRNKNVLAAYRPVAGTDWFIITKVDQDEVMVPLQKLVFWVSFIAFSAVIALSVALLILWRQQRRIHQILMHTQKMEAQDAIYDLAFYDTLTKLPNRRLLLDRLKQAHAASMRSGRQGALLLLDLDHFKTLNDTLGHHIGDLLLQLVAERISANVRQGDTVARFGGDEFVILLENLSEQAFEAAALTTTIAEKILSALNQPYQLAMHQYSNTPSIGATLFNGHDFAIDELLKQADIAMYQSKTEGRNTLRFFDTKMQEAIATRVDLEHELRKALELQQFQLHYQVQIDITGKPIGAEALIRWLHPERGMISPLNFIPMAEETGLILPIGQWVLDTACAQLKLWEQNELTQYLTLSVNVSAKQFHQASFVAQVQATVMRYAIDPSLLNLELTESMLLEDVNSMIVKMNTLREISIRFELDDFGTGYSSLQYLKQLPLYQLKIDQSFVRDIAIDSSDRALVRTIITMAHNLELEVIAEGVETSDQHQFLKNNGCTHYQGYLFGKPVPIDAFEALLRKS